MLKINSKIIRLRPNKQNFINLSWRQFDEAVFNLAQRLRSLINKRICLLSIARGGLPLATKLSHLLGCRNLAVIQVKMTRSDRPYDYGKAKIILEGFPKKKFDKFIIVEDIIYKGNSTAQIIKRLKKLSKKPLAICSLVIEDVFFREENKFGNLPIYTRYISPENSWVKFPWEKSKKLI